MSPILGLWAIESQDRLDGLAKILYQLPPSPLDPE